MGCQTSTEIKKFSNDQPIDPPNQKQQKNISNDIINKTQTIIKEKEEEAATKIQALYRGFRTRLKLQETGGDTKANQLKESKAAEEKRADALLKVVLEDKAAASQEARLNQRNNPKEEEVFRSLRKIIQKSIDQDELPDENILSPLEKVNEYSALVKDKFKETTESISSRVNSGIQRANSEISDFVEDIKQKKENITNTIKEETKQELEEVEQTTKETAENINNQMDEIVKNIQEINIGKLASEAVETVKEKVSDLLPDKVKEMLPEKEKKVDEISEVESAKDDETSKSTDKNAVIKDENNNPEKKQEEEIDIDLADPEVAKVASKLQATFKFKRHTKPKN